METLANDDEDCRASKKQITDTADKEHAVVSAEDLLIEILVRLPVFSLYLFKYVSKQWLSVIKSPGFSLNHRAQNRYLDIPPGLFVQRRKTQRPRYGYDLLSLNDRLPTKRYLFQTTFNEAGSNFEILQSCNGLLLCCIKGDPNKFYAYNPSTNLFKMVLQSSPTLVGSMRMAFDPTKSPNYKVVHAEGISDERGSYIQIQTYSSETGIWSLSDIRYPFQEFEGFHDGIYWNDAIHWLNGVHGQASQFKLDLVNEQPFLTNIQAPGILKGNVDRDCKLFESRGCLLLVCRENPKSWKLRIYEMSNVSDVWLSKYLVDCVDLLRPYLKTRVSPLKWDCSNVWCVVLGERDDDSFLVMDLYGKVIQLKIVPENFHTISVCGFVRPRMFQFIPSLASV